MSAIKTRFLTTVALLGATASCSTSSTKDISYASPAGASGSDSAAEIAAGPSEALSLVTPPVPAAPRAVARLLSGGSERREQEPRPGVLTAAAWDDAAHWSQYMKFVDRARENAWNVWGLEVDQSFAHRVNYDEVKPAPRRAVDIGFLVDATGSMGDEMTYLQSELKDIVRRVRAVEPDLDIRLSVVFYRDRGDSFITKSLPFTREVDEVVSFMSTTSADGGGDFPEDMNAGLEAMMRQRWSRDAVPQMLFLLVAGSTYS